MKNFLLLILLLQYLFVPRAYSDDSLDRALRTGELRWGGDAAGGAPYVFPNEDKPNQMIGFEVDIMERVASELGVRAIFVNVQWDQLVPALLRGDFDIAFNGLEITEERSRVIDFSIPYYFFAEQITVRENEKRFSRFDDLKNSRIGTLSASLAQNILEKDGRMNVVSYPSPVEAYRDLEIGRLDAVLMDVPIAAWYAGLNPHLKNLSELVGEGIYAGGLRKDSPRLKLAIDQALEKLIYSGELEIIYKKWNMWNPAQAKLKDLNLSNKDSNKKSSIRKFIPLLLQGALMTIVLSFVSMAFAILVGFLLCVGKLYGNAFLRLICNIYIEVIRGTPLLIQLYLLYYGLPNLGIQLNAFFAAVLGLGFNYAAYEAEIYRAGLLSVPKGQEEAARSIGMSGRQSLYHIVLPQAIRTILPPSTNDFIALFKDTSLVSIITVVELTRAYGQAATTTYRFLELGLITAALYFFMSFPLSLWSRSMEKSRQR